MGVKCERLLQEGGFLRRRGPAERGIAVGEAAEALHDLPMAPRIVGVVRRFRKPAQLRKQFQRAFLVGKRLAVLERQIDEHALHRQHARIPARRDHKSRRVQGYRIGGKRLRRASKHVARKLVGQHDQRKRARGVLAPRRQCATRRGMVQVEKPRTDLFVECGIFLEPHLAAFACGFAKPEAQYILRCIRQYFVRCAHGG